MALGNEFEKKSASKLQIGDIITYDTDGCMLVWEGKPAKVLNVTKTRARFGLARVHVELEFEGGQHHTMTIPTCSVMSVRKSVQVEITQVKTLPAFRLQLGDVVDWGGEKRTVKALRTLAPSKTGMIRISFEGASHVEIGQNYHITVHSRVLAVSKLKEPEKKFHNPIVVWASDLKAGQFIMHGDKPVEIFSAHEDGDGYIVLSLVGFQTIRCFPRDLMELAVPKEVQSIFVSTEVQNLVAGDSVLLQVGPLVVPRLVKQVNKEAGHMDVQIIYDVGGWLEAWDYHKNFVAKKEVTFK